MKQEQTRQDATQEGWRAESINAIESIKVRTYTERRRLPEGSNDEKISGQKRKG